MRLEGGDVAARTTAARPQSQGESRPGGKKGPEDKQRREVGRGPGSG
jgi:hypothetical protein